ncbi:MAG: flagellar biosynthesis protein FliQ [bacterium]
MTPESVITIGQEALTVTVTVAAPLLITALALGLIIGMFQAATQINEMTLSFIPKLLGLVVVLFASGDWLIQTMTTYMRTLITSIPSLIG